MIIVVIIEALIRKFSNSLLRNSSSSLHIRREENRDFLQLKLILDIDMSPLWEEARITTRLGIINNKKEISKI